MITIYCDTLAEKKMATRVIQQAKFCPFNKTTDSCFNHHGTCSECILSFIKFTVKEDEDE